MKQLVDLFHVLARLGRPRAVMLTVLLFVNSLLEGLGIATLVPLFVAMLGQDHAEMPPLAQSILQMLQHLGLPTETWLLAMIAAGALVMREVIAFAINIFAGFTINDMMMKLRRRMLTAIMQARWPWFHEQQLGGLSVSIAQFTTNAALAMELAVIALALILRTLVYMALVVLISPMLALIIAGASVLFYGPLLILVRMMRKYSGKFAGSTEQLSAAFSDIFGSIKAIRAMNAQQDVRPLLDNLIRRLRRYRKRVLLSWHGLTALQNILAILFVFSVLYLATHVLDVSVVEVGVVAGLTLAIVKNMARSQRQLQKMAEHAPYLDRVDELIRSARKARENTGGKLRPTLERGIEFADVRFAHPGKAVLQGVSFTLPAGKTSVIMGPSGAGKTTIIDLITGLQEADAGEIRIDGAPLSDIDLAQWRRMIGYVPQELVLLSGSVRENIALGADVSDEDVWRALELAGAREFVAELPDGLDTDLGERGVKLSGGQRQRLSLARALVRRPKLLILDEVTSALDPQTEQMLVAQIGALARREELTIVAITHTEAWRKIADKLLRLRDGKVREEAPNPA